MTSLSFSGRVHPIKKRLFSVYATGLALSLGKWLPQPAMAFVPEMDYALPAEYPSLSGEEKQRELWKRIQFNPYPEGQLPSAPPESLWTPKMLWNLRDSNFLITTFARVADDMPRKRLRYIHTYGSAGTIRFIPNVKSGFTGLFQESESIPGIIRLSLASLRSNLKKDPYIPGAALKLLIDKKPSENVVAIYSLSGQGTNPNFFAHSFSTRIDEPKSSILKFLSEGFKKALQLLSDQVRPVNERTLPVDRLAHIQKNGSIIPHSQAISPDSLIFSPSDSVLEFAEKNIVSTDTQTDFRVHLNHIPENTVLFKVYGTPAGSLVPIEVGEILLTSKLVSSPYVDQGLFFQHLVRWSRSME